MDDCDLAELNDKYRAPLMRHVVRLTFGDRYLAEDIVQETLLRLWQRPRTLATHHASVLPWLFTVSRNLVFDHQRARNVRPAEVSDAGIQDTPAAVDQIDAALTAHDIKRALFALSADHRAVLVAVYYRGRSLGEAAIELGIPLGTVKSRIYYALRALRPMVDKRCATTEMGRTVSTAAPTGNELSHVS
jgi:RNA polymerase sigma-70 factor (ECF subfamily)